MAFSAASSLVSYGGAISSDYFTTPETPFLKGFYSSRFVTERISSCAPYRVERIRKSYEKEEEEGIPPTDNHRRGALFCRTGVWLELLPFENEEDDTSGVRVRGTREESSKFSLVEFISVAMSLVSIRGVETKHFVCMDPSGRLYATPSTNYSTECVFVEDMMENYYNQYSSCAYGGRVQPWFMEFRKNGKPRRGASSKKRRKASHFIMVHHDLERLRHPHKPNGNDVTSLVAASLFHRPPSRPLWRPHITTKPPNPHRISNLRAKVEVAMDSAEKAKLLKEKKRRERRKKNRRREDRLQREEAKREARRQEIKRLREEELKNADEVLRRYQLYKTTNRYGRPLTAPYTRVTRPPPTNSTTTTVTPPRAPYPYQTVRPTYAPYNPYWETGTTPPPHQQHPQYHQQHHQHPQQQHLNVPIRQQNPPNRANPNPLNYQQQQPPNYHVHSHNVPNVPNYLDPQGNYHYPVPAQQNHQPYPQNVPSRPNQHHSQIYPTVQQDHRSDLPADNRRPANQHPQSDPRIRSDPRGYPDPRSQQDPRVQPNTRSQPDSRVQLDPRNQADLRIHTDYRNLPDLRNHPDLRSQQDSRAQQDPRYLADPRNQPDPRIQPDPRVPTDPRIHLDSRVQPDPRIQPDPRVQLDPRIHPHSRTQPDPRSQQDPRIHSHSQLDPRSLPNHLDPRSQPRQVYQHTSNHQQHQPPQLQHQSYQTPQVDPRIQQSHRIPPQDPRSLQQHHQNAQSHHRYYPDQHPQTSRPNISYQRYP